jgi:hypothetical protein
MSARLDSDGCDRSLAGCVARTPPAVQHAITVCVAALKPLDDQDRRMAVAVLMIAVREGGLDELGAPRVH